MRAPLLLPGGALLAVSLLITVLLLAQAPGTADDVRVYGLASWFADAALYVGSGLTVAGAVLRVVRAGARQDEHAELGRDWYAGE